MRDGGLLSGTVSVKLARIASLGFALLLGLIEFAGVVGSWHPSHATLVDAYYSSALVYALFASVFLLAGLAPGRGIGRFAMLGALNVIVIPAAAVLFSSWVTRWLIGQPINPDTARELAANPASAILHLSEGGRVVAGVFAGAMFLFVYACSRMVSVSERAWSRGHLQFRAAGAAACVTLFGFASWGVANASLSWSSYAAVVSRPNEHVPATYQCPRSQPVHLSPVPAANPVAGTPVILVILESLRADVLRDHPDAMPFVAALAKESLVFDKAYAPATHSDFSDIAIWYSRYPLFAPERTGYPADAAWRGTSAFEYFKASGAYRAGYFSSQNEFWGGMIHWMKLPAQDAFFDAHNLVDRGRLSKAEAREYMQRLSSELTLTGKVPDHRTLDMAADWAVRHANEPFFLGLNLQNTHDPYLVPDGAPQPFQPADSSARDLAYAWPVERAPFQFNRYLNAAYNMDALVAQFAQRLREAGLWDRSIILFVGDHGEAFREHGFVSHGGPAYEETSRVLALVKLPRGDRRNGTVYSQPVSSIDFVPMLTELAGLPEWGGFQGRSPLRVFVPAPRFILVDGLTRGAAVVQWPWKLMNRTFPEQRTELYNLEADPKESRNLVLDESARATALTATLDEWRTCQLSYYGDRDAYTTLQPPRY
jgi:arylsulfatase A-like enzyme